MRYFTFTYLDYIFESQSVFLYIQPISFGPATIQMLSGHRMGQLSSAPSLVFRSIPGAFV